MSAARVVTMLLLAWGGIIGFFLAVHYLSNAYHHWLWKRQQRHLGRVPPRRRT